MDIPTPSIQGLGARLRLAGDLLRDERELRRAARHMPRPVPWDWAAPRIIPLLSGPRVDLPGEPLVRVRTPLGPIGLIGVDLGTAIAHVDEAIAQRWECSPMQLFEQGMRNLVERAARIDQRSVQQATFSGRHVRIVRDRPRWASSLVLDVDTLTRLFGGHDQIFSTPTSSTLLSLPIETPSRAVADIQVDYEAGDVRHSLWMDPFVLEDGVLHWLADLTPEDDPD